MGPWWPAKVNSPHLCFCWIWEGSSTDWIFTLSHSCFAFFSLAWGRGDNDLKNFTVIEPRWTIGLQECACVKSEHQCELKLAEPADAAGPPVKLQLKVASLLSVKCQSFVICYWTVMSSIPPVPSIFRILAGQLGPVCGEHQELELWLSSLSTVLIASLL